MISFSQFLTCKPISRSARRCVQLRYRATTDHSTGGDTHPVESSQSPLLNRAWLLKTPNTEVGSLLSLQQKSATYHTQACTQVQIRKVTLDTGQLLVLQDDLLHPILGGNKLRKLDALLSEVKASGCTDLVRQAGQSTSQVVRQCTMV